ncbi:MAG: glycoside hydrolase family 43 protein [Ignavibacteriales bacterium]|nr:glycoside hydrolase family 43 protein [Ignavibacteriales bacterium]
MKILLTLICLSITASFSGGNATERDVYVFCYFEDGGKDGLHLAYSYDGLHWTALNNDESFLRPQVGEDKLFRDPCIVYGTDSVFHMVWTVSWNEKGIGYTSSRDLIHWSTQKYLPVMEHEPDAKNCWAPEIFYDDIKHHYMIFWATTIPGRFPETDDQDNGGTGGKGYNHRIYCVTTKDFCTFSDAKILFDPGFNVIDATIEKVGKEYLLIFKDETNKPFTLQKNIKIAGSNDVEGPYAEVSKPITGNYWAEGPTVISMGNRWYLYFDKYRSGEYGLLVSNDFKNWTDISDSLKVPMGMRHGTVLKIKGKVLGKLLKEQYNEAQR